MTMVNPSARRMQRRLDAYDVLVRRNEAVSILDKVRAFRVGGKAEARLDARVSSQKPFGLRAFVHGAASSKGLKHPIKLYGSQRISWVERATIDRNAAWIDEWKVLMTRVQGTSAAVETMFLSGPIIAGPGEACTESYVVAGGLRMRKPQGRMRSFCEPVSFGFWCRCASQRRTLRRMSTRSSQTSRSTALGPTRSSMSASVLRRRRSHSSSRL